MTRQTGRGVGALSALGAIGLVGCMSAVTPRIHLSASPPAGAALQPPALQEAKPSNPAPDAAKNLNAFPNTRAPYTLVDIPNPYDPMLSEERRTMLRGAPDRVMAAPVDPTRLETQMVNFSAGGARCSVLGKDGLCVRTMDGPFVLTDFAAVGTCADALFLGSAPISEQVDAELRLQPLWLVPVSQAGAFGAHFYVAAGERLIAVLKPTRKKHAKDPQCALTWSGFRPRMLPANGE